MLALSMLFAVSEIACQAVYYGNSNRPCDIEVKTFDVHKYDYMNNPEQSRILVGTETKWNDNYNLPCLSEPKVVLVHGRYKLKNEVYSNFQEIDLGHVFLWDGNRAMIRRVLTARWRNEDVITDGAVSSDLPDLFVGVFKLVQLDNPSVYGQIILMMRTIPDVGRREVYGVLFATFLRSGTPITDHDLSNYWNALSPDTGLSTMFFTSCSSFFKGEG